LYEINEVMHKCDSNFEFPNLMDEMTL